MPSHIAWNNNNQTKSKLIKWNYRTSPRSNSKVYSYQNDIPADAQEGTTDERPGCADDNNDGDDGDYDGDDDGDDEDDDYDDDCDGAATNDTDDDDGDDGDNDEIIISNISTWFWPSYLSTKLLSNFTDSVSTSCIVNCKYVIPAPKFRFEHLWFRSNNQKRSVNRNNTTYTIIIYNCNHTLIAYFLFRKYIRYYPGTNF